METFEEIKSLIQGATSVMTKTADKLDVQSAAFKELKAQVGELEQEFARIPVDGLPSARHTVNPVASQIIESEGLERIRNGVPSTGKVTIEQGLRAAISNPDVGQDGDSAYPTPARRAGGIQGIVTPRLSILDMLSVIKTGERTYEYVVLDDYINAADYQLKEGDLKQQTDMPTKLSRAEVATIAHWLPASLQVLDDNNGLINIVSQVLSVGCRQKLEHEVLVGAGGEGKILGIVPQAQAFIATMAGPADRVGEALTDLNSAGWNASAVVMNPSDWFAIASERAETGNGQYVLGSPRDPAPASLWSAPVVTSPSMPAGQALVLDTSIVSLLDRQQVSVQLSRHDGDNFRRNLVTVLAELRSGLVLYAPAATRLVTLSV
tara:strand:+ start:4224 stop:5357 length:1134 start_codon:yes stop_codon:yes gene_type:complete